MNLVVKWIEYKNFVIKRNAIVTKYTLWQEKSRFGKIAIYIRKNLC